MLITCFAKPVFSACSQVEPCTQNVSDSFVSNSGACFTGWFCGINCPASASTAGSTFTDSISTFTMYWSASPNTRECFKLTCAVGVGAAGGFKANAGATTCTACPALSQSAGGEASSCTCVANATNNGAAAGTTTGITTSPCVCKPGFKDATTSCSHCGSSNNWCLKGKEKTCPELTEPNSNKDGCVLKTNAVLSSTSPCNFSDPDAASNFANGCAVCNAGYTKSGSGASATCSPNCITVNMTAKVLGSDCISAFGAGHALCTTSGQPFSFKYGQSGWFPGHGCGGSPETTLTFAAPEAGYKISGLYLAGTSTRVADITVVNNVTTSIALPCSFLGAERHRYL